MKINKIISFLTTATLLANLPLAAIAAVPSVLMYEGRLLDTNYDPITTAHTFRISLWSSEDWIDSDTNGDGTLNTGAGNYAGWFEEQDLSPNANGSFSLQLGSSTALPDLDFDSHKYIQVEVKAQGDPDTSYELIDVNGDAGADTRDRSTIGSVAYSMNSESSSNSNEEVFIIDNDNSIETAGTGSISLQFGNTLGKFLSYDTDNNYFNFNDSVNIEGNLSLTGDINGTDWSIDSTGDITGVSLDADGSGNSITNIENDDIKNGANIDFTKLATRTKTIPLTINDVAVTVDGSNNFVNVYVDSESGSNPHRYYIMETSQATLQDLELIFKIKLPEDFVDFSGNNDLSLFYKNTGTDNTDSKIDILVEDNDGDDAFTATDGQNLFNLAWTEYLDEFEGVDFDPTAGEYIYVTVKGYTSFDGSIQSPYIGEIVLTYIGR